MPTRPANGASCCGRLVSGGMHGSEVPGGALSLAFDCCAVLAVSSWITGVVGRWWDSGFPLLLWSCTGTACTTKINARVLKGCQLAFTTALYNPPAFLTRPVGRQGSACRLLQLQVRGSQAAAYPARGAQRTSYTFVSRHCRVFGGHLAHMQAPRQPSSATAPTSS
jgi:hypothetical protein